MIVANAIMEGDVVTVMLDSGVITNVRIAHVSPIGFLEFFHDGHLYTVGLDAELYDLDF